MPPDAKVLDRVQKLLRLATNNPDEEEARTAALQAVKLIVEQGLIASAPGATSRQPVGPQYQGAWWNDLGVDLAEAQRFYREEQERRNVEEEFREYCRQHDADRSK